MRQLKKYFDALRLLSRVPSTAIQFALTNVIADSEACVGSGTERASEDDRRLVANLLRAVIAIAKADEAAAEKASKADKP